MVRTPSNIALGLHPDLRMDHLGVLGVVHKLRHLFSDPSRPPRTPVSSCVIFWLTPRTPRDDDVIYGQLLENRIHNLNTLKLPLTYFHNIF